MNRTKVTPPDDGLLDYRKVLDQMTSPCMIMSCDLVIEYANDAYLEATDRTYQSVIGRHVFDAFPDTEERMDSVGRIFLETLNGDITKLEKQEYELEHADGTFSTHIWQTVQTPYRDASGQVTHIVQVSEDVTIAENLRLRNDTIAAELDHRVRNLFSVILAIAAMSGRDSTSVEDFKKGFSERLQAMSRTHSALSDTNQNGIELRAVLEGELEQYGYASRKRINLSGPRVMLNRKVTQDMSMLAHELATNAAKYGCFSVPEGRLDVTWTVEPEGRGLVVRWVESGLTGIKPPQRLGFGTQLTEWMPNIRISREFRPTGLVVEFAVPLPIAVKQAPGLEA